MRRKYERVYHYLEARWAIEDLEKKRIKLSVFDNVNDPRELRAYTLRPYEKQIEVVVEWFAKTFCLLCFAPDSCSPQMWDCYGDKGNGICLGFDIKRSMVTPVEYVDKLKVVDFPIELVKALKRLDLTVTTNPSPTVKRGLDYLRPFFLTKFSEWSHEKERRALLNRDEEENGFYFARFFKSGMFLQEVILGEDCDASEDYIRSLLMNYPRQPIIVRKMTRLEE